MSVEEIAEAVINLLTVHAKTPDERVDVIRKVGQAYCLHCGDSLGGRTCYCQNDE